MHTSIIIVNYNSSDDTLACTNSLLASNTIYDYNIIIVDNLSTDDSYLHLSNSLVNSRCILLKAESNLGYCAGNNIGIQYAHDNFNSDFFWILNPDTIIDENALEYMINYMSDHENVGLLGSLLVYYPEKELIQSLGGGYVAVSKKLLLEPTPHLYHLKSIHSKLPDSVSVDLLNGASLLIRNNLITEIGFLDETFFMYSDENEYCLRAKQAGWQIHAISNAVIYHKEGWRKGNNSWATYYIIRNWLYVLKKYYPKYLKISIVVILIHVLFFLITGKINRGIMRVKAIKDFSKNIKGKVDLQYNDKKEF